MITAWFEPPTSTRPISRTSSLQPSFRASFKSASRAGNTSWSAVDFAASTAARTACVAAWARGHGAVCVLQALVDSFDSVLEGLLGRGVWVGALCSHGSARTARAAASLALLTRDVNALTVHLPVRSVHGLLQPRQLVAHARTRGLERRAGRLHARHRRLERRGAHPKPSAHGGTKSNRKKLDLDG